MVIYRLIQIHSPLVYTLAGVLCLIGLVKIIRTLRLGVFFSTLILLVGSFLIPVPGCDIITITFCTGSFVVIKVLIVGAQKLIHKYQDRKQKSFDPIQF